jgi:prepilin-type N-terminal cleavage/methylation domain-containing protein
MTARRGFTLMEMVVAVAVLILFFGIAFAVLLPVLAYLSPAQAKINTQENAVPLLYKLQREVRESDYRTVYAVVSGSTQPLTSISSFTDVQTFAVATAKTGTPGGACFPGGDFQTVPGAGTPYWQGFDVFMLQNAALKCVYEPLGAPQINWNRIQTTDATSAITTAKTAANPPIFGNAVLDIKLETDPTAFVADFQIKAVSTVNGRSNETTYTEDVLTRD